MSRRFCLRDALCESCMWMCMCFLWGGGRVGGGQLLMQLTSASPQIIKMPSEHFDFQTVEQSDNKNNYVSLIISFFLLQTVFLDGLEHFAPCLQHLKNCLWF